MKRIILFSLLALTACKKEEETAPATVTFQVTGSGMVGKITHKSKDYYNPLPTLTIAKGETATFTDNGAHPSESRNIKVFVNGKETYSHNGTGAANYSYTHK